MLEDHDLVKQEDNGAGTERFTACRLRPILSRTFADPRAIQACTRGGAVIVVGTPRSPMTNQSRLEPPVDRLLTPLGGMLLALAVTVAAFWLPLATALL